MSLQTLPFRGAHFYAALRTLTTTDAMYDQAPTEEELTHALQQAIILDKNLRKKTADLFHFVEGHTSAVCLELEDLANDAQECMLVQPDGSTFTRRHYHFTKRTAGSILHELPDTEQERLIYVAKTINNCLNHPQPTTPTRTRHRRQSCQSSKLRQTHRKRTDQTPSSDRKR